MPLLHLHPDPTRTLAPLLETHLPNSISTLGSIQFHASVHPAASAWATFPATGPPPPGPWVVIAHQTPPSTHQIRLYCSHEKEAPFEETSRAEELVLGCVRELKRENDLWKDEEMVLVGGVNTMWFGCLGGEVDELDDPGATYSIFLAPETPQGGDEGGLAALDGLEIRAGEQEDVDKIIATSKIPRPADYITSLLSNSSVATLPSQADPSVRETAAWVLTHSDLSLGSLYVLPQHRRKGLAKRVVHHRLAQPGAFRGVVYVETGNEASQELWKTLGWEKAWETVWARYKD